MAGRIARGEVRLFQFAAPDKKRPALVLTRDGAITYWSTSRPHLSHPRFAAYHQRLGKRVAQLSSARMNEVRAALRFSLGCDSN